MNPLIILAVLGAGAVAIGSAFRREVKAQVKRARNELLEIGPNCSFIRLRKLKEGSSEKEVNKKLALARKYYFGPAIAAASKLFPLATFPNSHVWSMAIMGYVLEDLIPECEWSPAPKVGDPRFVVYLVLGNWIRIEALTGIACDPLDEAPPGLLCVPNGKGHVLVRRK